MPKLYSVILILNPSHPVSVVIFLAKINWFIRVPGVSQIAVERAKRAFSWVGMEGSLP